MTTKENTNITYGKVEPFRWESEARFPSHSTGGPLRHQRGPANRIDELAEFLASLGVPMDPKLQVLAINRDPLHPVSFVGEDVPRLVEDINDHLLSRDIQPLIPENHQEWSVRRRHALLTMAAHHFSWVYQQRVPSLWDSVPGYTQVFQNGCL